MYSMKPILEQDVIDLLNNGRFEGDLDGYVLSDGADLFGWSLFRVDSDVTVMLDVLAPDFKFLDGLIRASVALGESRGTTAFSLNMDVADFAKYKQVFFENEGYIIPNDKLFTPCHGE